MTKQRLPILTIAMLLFAWTAPAAMAAGAPPAPAPTTGRKAGSITALLPIAHIERGAGRAKVTTDAKRGDDVIWNDMIRTERGGRARITLVDQSILSLGSQSDLRIVKHDARSQQTALTMAYGRVRAEVAKVTRQGGSFELRTPTAVAGVIGTDFGVNSDPTAGSTFVCISGLVQVSNSDPNIAGSVQCAPGMTTTVTPGKAPTPPTNASPAQIQQLIQDTEPALITAMSPLSALPGTTLDATLTGTKMTNVNAVSVNASGTTPAGITVSLGTVSDTSVTVHMVIAPDAAPGPRTIHLAKSSGADSAAVFTVMAPPNAAQGGDYSKPFLDLFATEGQTTLGGLTSFLATLQQSANQALQQLQQLNADTTTLSNANTQFNSQVTTVQGAINDASQQIANAVAQAAASFQTQYNAANQALLQRNPSGTPDDQFNQAVKAAFDSTNASLGQTFKSIITNLQQAVTAANTNIATAQQSLASAIVGKPCDPGQICPAVNTTDKSVDVGAAIGGPGVAALDASASKASTGGSIVSYQWVLCDPSYKPAQTGVALPGSATAGCNAMTGYASTSADFQFPTCNLQPNDYVARVKIIDTNNQSAAMDVKLHILAGAYDDPPTVVRDLAQAYGGLQINNFLGYFDQTGFSGFTALSENVRNTFPTLTSMSINPRISQSAITCNDATVRADWVQNYTYKTNAAITFNQTEQLSIRMTRTPGKGWLITDFQGDNGTVQGQLPGPAVTSQPLPDLTITTGNVFPGTSPGAAVVATGAQVFSAVVQNIGGADFTANTVVHIEMFNGTQSQGSVDVPLPVPLAAGASVTVQGTLNVPATLAPGTIVTVQATVNPPGQNAPPEADTSNNGASSAQLTIGGGDLQVTSAYLTSLGAPSTSPIQATSGPYSFTAVVKNGGNSNFLGTTVVRFSVSSNPVVYVDIPLGVTSLSPGATVTVQGTINVPGVVGSLTVTANVNPGCTAAETSCGPENFFTQTLAMNALATQVTTPQLLAGSTTTSALTFSVYQTSTLTLTLPAGITATQPLTQVVNSGGSFTWTLTADPTATGATAITLVANDGVAVTVPVNYSVANYQVTSSTFAGHSLPLTGANALQVGEPNAALVVTLANVGNATLSGTVNLGATCKPLNPNDTTSCTGGNNPSGSVAAPAANTAVTVTMPLGAVNNMLPGSFAGTISYTTSTQLGTVSAASTLSFDVVDFVVAVQNALSPQYLLPNSTQNFTVAVQVVGTPAFPVPVTLSLASGGSGLTFVPGSANVSGTQVFGVLAASTAPTGAAGVVATGLNHGVSHPAAQAFLVINPVITPTALLVNDPANPLAVPVGSATPQQVGLQITGSAFSAAATIVLPTVTGFALTTDATAGAVYSSPFNVFITANSASPSPVALTVVAQLPNTNPVLSITKTLYVLASGLPDLTIVSATPSISFSSATPWIDGEGVDYQVVLQNTGNAPSAGNEKVTVEINGEEVGVANLSGTPLAAGASQTVTVHAVAPDIHGNTPFGPTNVSGRIHVDPKNDVQLVGGEVDYTNNSLALSVPMANWHIAVNGVGSQSAPLQIALPPNGTGTGTVAFSGTIDGGASFGSYSSLSFVPTPGQVSSSFSISNLGNGTAACGTTPPLNTMFCATVATSSTIIQTGAYFAQALVTLTDPTTGQQTVRQATAAMQIGTGPNPAVPCLTSSANNITSQDPNCGSTTATTLEINGGLSEQFSATMSMICGLPTAAIACSGAADWSIQDAPNTTTVPGSSIKYVFTGAPVVLRVGANMDSAGNVVTGMQPYIIGINGVQQPGARRGSAGAPDAIGVKVNFAVQVGDIDVTATGGTQTNGGWCGGVVPGGSGLPVTISWNLTGGFNANVTWEIEDTNHAPVGGSPFGFTATSGSGTGSISETITNTTGSPVNTLTRYFLAATASTPTSGSATATKYFPFFIDGSTGQSFCGAISAARGTTRVSGSWSRSAADMLGPISGGGAAIAAARTQTSATGSIDLQLVSSDISFTPSIPKAGDTLQVRFSVRNGGTADATKVPIALQVNGVTVASDTFDVAAGHSTLGGLSWVVTAPVADVPTTASRRRGRLVAADEPAYVTGGLTPLQAAIVIDPGHLTQQATTAGKSATLPHLNVRPGQNGVAAIAPTERVLIELEDGACAGLRLSSGGVGPCGNADLEITVADLAKSQLGLDTLAGVSDVGSRFETAAGRAASYNQQAAGIAGHAYSVRLADGSTQAINIESIRNPSELDAKARALFRAGATRILRNLGDSSGAAAPGDLTGVDSRATVFITLTVLK